MSLSSLVNDLATRIGQEVKAVRAELTSGLSGKAATTHNHAAGDIDSGTLGIARVPTGTSSTTVALGDHAHAGQYDLAGAAADAVADHEAATDPHPQYLTTTEGAAAYSSKLTPTAVKTSAYTASVGELVLCDDSAGSFTVTLPACATGAQVGVKKVVSSGNSVTISRAGTDTIGGAAGTTINLRLVDQTTTLQGNGSNWMPIHNWVGLPSTDSRYARPDQATTFTAAQTFSTKVVQTPVALTDAATIAVDAALGNHFAVTLGGNRTLGNPTNGTHGQKIIVEVIQDATGSRTLVYDTAYAFGADIPAPVLTTTAAKRDYLGFVYNSTAGKWFCIAVAKGY